MKFSRRELIAHLRNIIGTAGAYPLITSPLLGQAGETSTANDDEHFFIFVELKGGVHHTVTTDYPSIDTINKIKDSHNRAVMTFPLGDQYSSFLSGDQTTPAQQQRLRNDIEAALTGGKNKWADSIELNGYFCALPYDKAKADDYYYQSPSDSSIRLGPAALSLAEHAAKMSVLRGVFMTGTFHGLANEEIYSGSSDRKGSHVAGVLAQQLETKYGARPLDNLVLGRAAYVTANEGNPKPAVQVPFATIRALADKGAGDIGLKFEYAEHIARALQAKYGLGEGQSAILDEYLASFKMAGNAKENLKKLNFTPKAGDARSIELNLLAQLETCRLLIKSGMSRVLTVCVGQSQGFGGFDAHRYYYHDPQYADDMSYFKLTQLTMADLAAFITKMENEQYDENRKWKDVLTIVVSSEFGRSNNFNDSDNRVGQFGNGHYYFNNNYIFYGKNVQAGRWLGASDPITRYPHVADFTKLNSGRDEELLAAFADPLDKLVNIGDGSLDLGQKIALKEGYESGPLQIDADTMESASYLHQPGTTNRALMARDVVRTIMDIAGVESSFGNYYVDDFYKTAQVIKALVSKG